MATEALAVVAAAIEEEEGSEVEGGGALGEMVAVVTGSGMVAAVVVVAIATTEEDTNATSVKLLIIEVPTCGLAVVFIICLHRLNCKLLDIQVSYTVHEMTNCMLSDKLDLCPISHFLLV